MAPLRVANAKTTITDGTIIVANSNETDMNSPPSPGTTFLIYGTIGFFVLLGIFLICITADSMGRGLIRIGKRIFLADGAGHTSMLTEVIIFIVVVILACVYIVYWWNSTPPPNKPTRTYSDTYAFTSEVGR